MPSGRCARCGAEPNPSTAARTSTCGDVVVDPSAPRTDVPIWVGGRTRRSLRRAVELGDAWMPFLLTPDDVRGMLAWARTLPAWHERTHPLDVVLWPEPAVDALQDADRIRRQADAFTALGATVLNYRFRSDSLAHHLDQMDALTRVLDFD